MTYRKPKLWGHKAMAIIHSNGKYQGNADQPGTALRTEPAYEADE